MEFFKEKSPYPSVSRELLNDICALSPAGFRLVRFARVTDSRKDMIDEMPASWSAEYDRNGYAMGDPVFLWCLMNQGTMRWSEIEIQDYRSVLQKAKKHGLNFGAVAARYNDGQHSILSISQSAREFSDDELELCAKYLQQAMDEIQKTPALKPKEIEVLKHLSYGHTLEETAQQTGAAISTIKNRLSRARRSLGADTATQAVAKAVRLNLI